MQEGPNLCVCVCVSVLCFNASEEMCGAQKARLLSDVIGRVVSGLIQTDRGTEGVCVCVFACVCVLHIVECDSICFYASQSVNLIYKAHFKMTAVSQSAVQ